MRALLAFTTFRPAHMTQRSLATTNMRLTAIRNSSRDTTDCRVGIVVCRACNCFAGAAVATHKSRECGDRLVTNLGVGIRGQNLNKIGYNMGDANIAVTAPLAGETMESAFADGRDGVAQSKPKGVRRRVAGVVIQKGKTEAPHRRIRMAKRRDLHGGNGNLLAQTRSAVLTEREPSVDKIICDFEISPHHCIQSGPMVSRSLAPSLAPASRRGSDN